MSLVDPDELIVGEDGRNLLEKADNENGIDAITSTVISIGRDDSIELEWLEERMKKGRVHS